MTLPPINIQDYTYDLPEERIASIPLEKRDESKLLVYQNGQISHKKFLQLPDLLPDSSFLFFNNTKVIPARFFFQKESGATIEVFLLQPLLPSTILSATLASTRSTTWKCAIGNLKRWNDDLILKKTVGLTTIQARLIDRKNNIVELQWETSSLSFAEILHIFGAMPLPPYIKREATKGDAERYQTVYSTSEGAVAAPTAGLHFTPEILQKIESRGILSDFLTLHVSAGTFLPIKVENVVEHTMHTEQIIVSRQNINNLMLADKKVIAVGTTALRTLESIYWFGAKLLKSEDTAFVIDKLDPYKSKDEHPSVHESLSAVLRFMNSNGINEVVGETSIFIFPGYDFKIVKGLVTNFHQPGSTLLLLIAALVGDGWKRIYDEALLNSYRFLSYGDSSFLAP